MTPHEEMARFAHRAESGIAAAGLVGGLFAWLVFNLAHSVRRAHRRAITTFPAPSTKES